MRPGQAIFTGAGIARASLVTAAISGAITGAKDPYGYTTQRGLSRLGSFLVMGVVGILIAALPFAIPVIGVLVLAGPTACDTQRIRDLYYEDVRGDIRAGTKVTGVLTLHIDFMGVFMYPMNPMGVRRRTVAVRRRATSLEEPSKSPRRAMDAEAFDSGLFRCWWSRCADLSESSA